MAHLGSRISALLDGRLRPVEEEECWAHVHDCHTCRDLVEREGWVKTRLAELSLGPAAASDALKSMLRDQTGTIAPPAFPTAPRAARGRARGLLAIGGGAASACVVGVLALGAAGPTRVDPRPPTADLSRPVGPVAPVGTLGDSKRRRTPPSPGVAPLPESTLAGHRVVLREKMPS